MYRQRSSRVKAKGKRAFIYEHVSGGGFSGKTIPLDILSEGYGMLRSFISDVSVAGCQVTTFLDSRISTFDPPIGVDQIVPISRVNDLELKLENVFSDVDMAYIIAPESEGILDGIVEEVEDFGLISLNCRSEAIRKVSDKSNFYDVLRRKGLSVPRTEKADVSDEDLIRSIVKEIGFPLIFKPVRGVGCSGLSLVEDEEQLKRAIEKVERQGSDSLLIQEFIRGLATSVSLISNGREAVPIGLNKQIVELAPPSSDSKYFGGSTPLKHELKGKALAEAEKAVKTFDGLRGYVGVDMVLAEEEVFIIEVNPRLTTSYIGLRRVTGLNLAKAVVDSVVEGKLPKEVDVFGFSSFSKVKVPLPTIRELREIYKMEDVICPPFPLQNRDGAYALIATFANTLEEAEASLGRVKDQLLSIIGAS